MACAGRTFADVGRRLLASRALAKQKVAGTDGLLGSRGPKGTQVAAGGGLSGQYTKLVENAFQPALWSATGKWRLGADGTLAADAAGGYTQKELNFSLFFGLAIDAYERTLVSDDSPFDRHMDGAGGALSAAQLRGLALFEGKGKCAACHGGPALSSAASFAGAPAAGPIERMPMAVGQEAALYDTGFYNIGVRPAAEDVGVGGKDPYGTTLSYTRQFTANLPRTTDIPVDKFGVDPCGFEVPFSQDDCATVPSTGAGVRVAVDGAFKTPSLRNVALTPPYFHNGGEKNLADVVSSTTAAATGAPRAPRATPPAWRPARATSPPTSSTSA
jgi:hypothetical protein